MEPRPVLFSLLAVALLVSAATDLTRQRIYDWVTLPTIGLALGLRFFLAGVGDFDSGLVSGVAGALSALVIFAGFAVSGKGLAWADVKLIVAVGACLGTPSALAAVMLISLAGAVEGLAIGLFRRRPSATLPGLASKNPHTAGAGPLRIPYGVAVAVGSAWAVWWELSASP